MGADGWVRALFFFLRSLSLSDKNDEKAGLVRGFQRTRIACVARASFRQPALPAGGDEARDSARAARVVARRRNYGR